MSGLTAEAEHTSWSENLHKHSEMQEGDGKWGDCLSGTPGKPKATNEALIASSMVGMICVTAKVGGDNCGYFWLPKHNSAQNPEV